MMRHKSEDFEFRQQLHFFIAMVEAQMRLAMPLPWTLASSCLCFGPFSRLAYALMDRCILILHIAGLG